MKIVDSSVLLVFENCESMRIPCECIHDIHICDIKKNLNPTGFYNSSDNFIIAIKKSNLYLIKFRYFRDQIPIIERLKVSDCTQICYSQKEKVGLVETKVSETSIYLTWPDDTITGSNQSTKYQEVFETEDKIVFYQKSDNPKFNEYLEYFKEYNRHE